MKYATLTIFFAAAAAVKMHAPGDPPEVADHVSHDNYANALDRTAAEEPKGKYAEPVPANTEQEKREQKKWAERAEMVADHPYTKEMEAMHHSYHQQEEQKK